MTEKQFRLVNELGDYHIKDGDDELCYDLCSPSMAKENWNNVVNRLNELAEENQALKKFVKVNFSDMMAEKIEKELKNE